MPHSFLTKKGWRWHPVSQRPYPQGIYPSLSANAVDIADDVELPDVFGDFDIFEDPIPSTLQVTTCHFEGERYTASPAPKYR